MDFSSFQASVDALATTDPCAYAKLEQEALYHGEYKERRKEIRKQVQEIEGPAPTRGKRKLPKRKALSVEDLEVMIEAQALGVVQVKRCTNSCIEDRLIEVAQFYYRMLTDYNNKQFPYKWRERLGKSPQMQRACHLAATLALSMGATLENFVLSQFWWFDQCFSTTPKLRNLSGPGAGARYQKWLDAKDAGLRVDEVVSVKVIAVHPLAKTAGGKISLYQKSRELHPNVLKIQERVLREQVRFLGSEEQVWETHGALGNQVLFMDEYKLTRPIWVALYLDNEDAESIHEPDKDATL